VDYDAPLAAFQALVLEANQYLNLTAITDPQDFAVKHIADSLSLLPHLPPPCESRTLRLLDLGTGAGFPGVPIKIARPDIQLTLLDSTRKKLTFLETALAKLHIEAHFIHARAEELPRLQKIDPYDIITARAVAPLKKLITYALPLLAPSGTFLAMKSREVAQEITEAQPALKKHGGKVAEIIPVVLTPELTHTVVKIKR